MAASVFGERCVHLGNFIELSRLSSNLRSSFLPWRHLASQKISRTKQSTKGVLPVSYDKLQQLRLAEALRSVLILHPTHSVPVVEFCQQYGHIKNAISFQHNVKNYTLVEYRDVSGVDNVLANCRQFPNVDRIPVKSHLLYYHPGRERFRAAGRCSFPVECCEFVHNYRRSVLTELDLQKCTSVESQMWTLYRKLAMSDLDVRLRYFLCRDLEFSLRKLLPDVSVRPFGSSVNGFGRYDCDLDLVVNLDSNAHLNNGQNDSPLSKRQDGLFFLSKLRSGGDRRFTQRTLEVIAGLLQYILPQSVNVVRILQARVPIVKFSHVATGIDCDITLENEAAVSMSEVLHYLCQLDAMTRPPSTGSQSIHMQQRVSPLVFVIRQWARSVGVTSTSPGVGFSNFMLTLLVVFFLQTRRSPLLPALGGLKSTSSGPVKVLSQDISLPYTPVCIFNNNQSLDELLMDFFKFYASFDFAERGVSVITGSAVEKPDTSAPVYIENPLERELNVSKNVLEDHLAVFRTQCRLALDTLGRSSGALRSARSRDSWGLLSILKTDDQLQLTEEPAQSQTAPDEDVNNVPLMSTQADVTDTDPVGPRPQPLPAGVVNIREILQDDNYARDDMADNVSNRTV